MTHWFWLLLTIACMVWYSTITVYVGIKGIADIRQMLARLSEKREEVTAKSTKEDTKIT